MSIRPRGSTFIVDVKVGAKHNPTNKEVRVRVAAPDMTKARQLEAEIRATVIKHGMWTEEMQVSGGKLAKAKPKGTLAEALEEAWSYPSGRRRGWKFQKSGMNQYNRAKRVIKELGPDRLCASITVSDLEELTAKFVARAHSNNTITQQMQSFYRVLWHAQRKGWITHRPLWDRLAPGKPREFIFTAELEANVIDYFRHVHRDPAMAEMFIMGIETGMRLGELLSTTAERWMLEDRVVHVPHSQSKSGIGRYITLTDRAIETIRPIIEGKDRSFRPFPFNQMRVSVRMRAARDHLGMTEHRDFCFHATRHTRATRLARETRDPFLVMSQLGHSNVNISMRYIKMAAINVIPFGGPRAAGAQSA